MSSASPSPSAANRPGGIILAGGRSSRMGRPKAWLPLHDGRTMLETVYTAVIAGLALAGHPDAPVVVVAAPGQKLPALPPTVTVTRDEVEGQGPLQGLAAGMAALQGLAAVAFVSSCDAPLLRPAFVARLIDLVHDVAVAVPHVEGRHHPLAAAYRMDLLPMVQDLLAAGQRRPFAIFERCRTRLVTEGELAEVDPGLQSLRNTNTPGDYAALVGGSST